MRPGGVAEARDARGDARQRHGYGHGHTHLEFLPARHVAFGHHMSVMIVSRHVPQLMIV